MKEVHLTNNERLNLERELIFSRNYRNKQFRSLVYSISVGCILAGTISYLQHGSRDGKLFLGIIMVLALMLSTLGVGYLFSKNRINKLYSDLKFGKKIEGKSSVKKISFYNRKITLENGIKVHEPAEFNKTIKKGDLIKFKITRSNEYTFEIKLA